MIDQVSRIILEMVEECYPGSSDSDLATEIMNDEICREDIERMFLYIKGKFKGSEYDNEK